jgi:hypothetical protein
MLMHNKHPERHPPRLARPGYYNPFQRYAEKDDSPYHKAMTAYIELQSPLIEARRREAQEGNNSA